MNMNLRDLYQVIRDVETFAKNAGLSVSSTMSNGWELKFEFKNGGWNTHGLTVVYDLEDSRITPKFIYDNTRDLIKREFNIAIYDPSKWSNIRTNYMQLSKEKRRIPNIKDVIFNGPATIVIWADDTKTVVKCQEGDTPDPEKGLAMAMVKKALGNKGNYNDEFKKWLPE